MNAIRQTALLNKRELENATPPSASWHADYRDTAWLYIGGLPLELSEGDICIIFSQFGNPTHLNLIRDKETGKSKGFAFLRYEDQRSCDLAVDNLGGAEVLGRMLRIDHSRYKKRDGEDEETYRVEARERSSLVVRRAAAVGILMLRVRMRRRKKRRKLLKEEVELQEMLAIKADGEEEDPMREYLIQKKKAEVEEAKAREKDKMKHKHRHRRHADREDEEKDGEGARHRRVGADEDKRSKHRSRDQDGARRQRRRDGSHRRRRSPSRSRSRSPWQK